MATTDTARLMLRLPTDLHRQLQERAEAHERSLNSEIVFALRRYVEGVSRIEYAWDDTEEEVRRAWTARAGETLRDDEEEGWEYTEAERDEVERLFGVRP